MQIQSGGIGKTVRVGDHVTITILDTRRNQVCLFVMVPPGMTVSSDTKRKAIAKDEIQMGFWRIGETVLVGDSIAITVLGVSSESARLGVTVPEGITVRSEYAQDHIDEIQCGVMTDGLEQTVQQETLE